MIEENKMQNVSTVLPLLEQLMTLKKVVGLLKRNKK